MTASDLNAARLAAHPLIDECELHVEIGSTNDRARDRAADLSRDQTLLVIAERQTAGRGRGSNRWWTGDGALACSLLFDPLARGIARENTGLIALATAVALVETVTPLVPHQRAGLHWPNDVFLGDRKLAGILVEVLPDGRYIVGLGCNVNNSVSAAPDDLASIVTSLRDATQREFDRTELLSELFDQLGVALHVLVTEPAELGRHSDRHCLQHGRSLTIRVGSQEETGVCEGIADDGALVLSTARGRQTFYSGVLVKALPKF